MLKGFQNGLKFFFIMEGSQNEKAQKHGLYSDLGKHFKP